MVLTRATHLSIGRINYLQRLLTEHKEQFSSLSKELAPKRMIIPSLIFEPVKLFQDRGWEMARKECQRECRALAEYDLPLEVSEN